MSSLVAPCPFMSRTIQAEHHSSKAPNSEHQRNHKCTQPHGTVTNTACIHLQAAVCGSADEVHVNVHRVHQLLHKPSPSPFARGCWCVTQIRSPSLHPRGSQNRNHRHICLEKAWKWQPRLAQKWLSLDAKQEVNKGSQDHLITAGKARGACLCWP